MYFAWHIGEDCVRLPSRPAQHRPRGSAGRSLRDPHLAGGAGAVGNRVRAQLQGSHAGTVRLPYAEDGGPAGAPDPPPPVRSRTGAPVPVPIGLLRGVAHARGVATVAVLRRRAGRAGPQTEPGRAGGAVG